MGGRDRGMKEGRGRGEVRTRCSGLAVREQMERGGGGVGGSGGGVQRSLSTQLHEAYERNRDDILSVMLSAMSTTSLLTFDWKQRIKITTISEGCLFSLICQLVVIFFVNTTAFKCSPFMEKQVVVLEQFVCKKKTGQDHVPNTS